jgi:hypothetical protein
LTLNTRNAGTLKPWNIGTLKPSVRRKEIPFVTYLSALHSKPNALRYTLYAGTLKPWNIGTLEPWNPGTLEPWNLISGKSEIFENFLFPIFCTRSRYENSNTLIGNGKWEIGNFVIGNPWNSGTPELWNLETLELRKPSTLSLVPRRTIGFLKSNRICKKQFRLFV